LEKKYMLKTRPRKHPKAYNWQKIGPNQENRHQEMHFIQEVALCAEQINEWELKLEEQKDTGKIEKQAWK
jgi:hypothetical protein